MGYSNERPASLPAPPMVVVPDGAIGREHQVGRVVVSPETLSGYALRSGDTDWSGADSIAPIAFSLTFLALRRRGDEDLRIDAKAFSVHGGHDIDQIEPICAGQSYVVRSAIAVVYEKSGRSGQLTVIERLSRLENEATRNATAIVRERQVVRWRPRGGNGSVRPRYTAPLAERPTAPPASIEVGAEIAREIRRGPAREDIASWATHLGEREVLFTDTDRARGLGYEDLVVPGPMLSAFVGQMLRRALPDASVRTLSMTFRQSLLAGEPIVLTALATEYDGERRVTCDIVVESGAGETCAIGTATLLL